MNSVILTGRVVENPIFNATNNTAEPGKIAHFSLAVDSTQTDKNGERKTAFVVVTAFRKYVVDFLEKHIEKGDKITISGSLEDNSYTNKEGKRISQLQVVVTNIEFAESKADKDRRKANAAQQTAPQQMPTSAPQYQQTAPQYQQVAPQQMPQQMPQYQQPAPQQMSQQMSQTNTMMSEPVPPIMPVPGSGTLFTMPMNGYTDVDDDLPFN